MDKVKHRFKNLPVIPAFVLLSTVFILIASDAYKIIGNAVPPVLAYSIAANLESKWNRYFKDTK